MLQLYAISLLVLFTTITITYSYLYSLLIIVLLQELTEEGVPFLILFHHPDDKDTPAQFLEQVNLQLANDRGNNICCFIAFFTLIW